MTVYKSLILAFWLALIVFWLIMAGGAKRSTGGWEWRRELGFRLVILIFVVVALKSPAFRREMWTLQMHLDEAGSIIDPLGVALCGAGAGLAIWARVQLGRNWGMPMSRREEPELVTTGPYGLVRHPIYGGLLVAMLGSAIAGSVYWALPLVLIGTYFVYSARSEEELMISQFPEKYPEYMRRTKMLLP